MTKGKSTIMLSGGFDPIHVGHVRMIAAAAEIGDVIVVANSDDWLMRKKGYIFMPWEERAEIIASITGVKEVGTVKDGDGTVCEALERVRPTCLATGAIEQTRPPPKWRFVNNWESKWYGA